MSYEKVTVYNWFSSAGTDPLIGTWRMTPWVQLTSSNRALTVYQHGAWGSHCPSQLQLHSAGHLASRAAPACTSEPSILTILKCPHNKESHSADSAENRHGEVRSHSPFSAELRVKPRHPATEQSVFALSLCWALQTHPGRGFPGKSTLNLGGPGMTTEGLWTLLNT